MLWALKVPPLKIHLFLSFCLLSFTFLFFSFPVSLYICLSLPLDSPPNLPRLTRSVHPAGKIWGDIRTSPFPQSGQSLNDMRILPINMEPFWSEFISCLGKEPLHAMKVCGMTTEIGATAFLCKSATSCCNVRQHEIHACKRFRKQSREVVYSWVWLFVAIGLVSLQWDIVVPGSGRLTALGASLHWRYC